MKKYLNKILSYEDLSFDEMKGATEMIMTGKVDQSEIESFLLALNQKGAM
jgi:anthranilate phosphoribosyltransferase